MKTLLTLLTIFAVLGYCFTQVSIAAIEADALVTMSQIDRLATCRGDTAL